MTTSRYGRWQSCRRLVTVGLCAASAIAMLAAPAMATPGTPSPSPSASAPSHASSPTTAPAAGSITWAVQPSSAQGPDRRSTFTYNELKPGTVVHDYVAVTNYSKMAVTFQLYATDAFETTTGSLDLLTAANKPTDVGTWVTLLKNSIRLQPSERANIPFSLVIPANATPGDHTGGIIAAVNLATTDKTGARVIVDRRLATPLYVRVTGALKPSVAVESVSTGGFHGSINPFGGGNTSISYTIKNTGNVRLNAAQVVSVSGLFGIPLATRHPKQMTDLLPGASVRVVQSIGGVFPLGPITVHVKLTPTEVNGFPTTGVSLHPDSRSVSMWATPWPQLLVLLLLAAAIYGFIRWRRRSKQEMDNKLAAAVAKARREAVEEAASARESAGAVGGNGKRAS
jgi:hypothetical protein